jgi:hypothetical protein
METKNFYLNQRLEKFVIDSEIGGETKCYDQKVVVNGGMNMTAGLLLLSLTATGSQWVLL